MSGNKEGGLAAAQTIKKLYGEDFYIEAGRKGGLTPKSSPHGFRYMKLMGQDEKIRAAGQKGGKISKRGPSRDA